MGVGRQQARGRDDGHARPARGPARSRGRAAAVVDGGPRWGALGLIAVAGNSQLLSFALQASGYADLRPQIAALLLALSVDAAVLMTLLRQAQLPGWLAALLIARVPAVPCSPGCRCPSWSPSSDPGGRHWQRS